MLNDENKDKKVRLDLNLHVARRENFDIQKKRGEGGDIVIEVLNKCLSVGSVENRVEHTGRTWTTGSFTTPACPLSTHVVKVGHTNLKELKYRHSLEKR
jgi:hypothetical protein